MGGFSSLRKGIHRAIGGIGRSVHPFLDKHTGTIIKVGAAALTGYAAYGALAAKGAGAKAIAAKAGGSIGVGGTGTPIGLASAMSATGTAPAALAGATGATAAANTLSTAAGASTTTKGAGFFAKAAKVAKVGGKVVGGLQVIGAVQGYKATQDLSDQLGRDEAALNSMMQEDRPTAIPTPDGDAAAEARKRALAKARGRRGRNASIMSDPSRTALG